MASRNATFADGVFLRVLLAPLKLLVGLGIGLLVVLLTAWLVDVLCVRFVWSGGLEHLKAILTTDYARGVALAAMQGGSSQAISDPANLLYRVLFEFSGIHEMGLRFANPAALSIPDTVARANYIAGYQVIETAMVATQLVGVRLATLFRFLPLITLIYVVAITDGLAERQIRVWSAGLESSNLYHRAKYLQASSWISGTVTIAVWPAALDMRPAVALLLAAGILARIQMKYYKKYP